MATPEDSVEDIFFPGAGCARGSASAPLPSPPCKCKSCFASETRWDSVPQPHSRLHGRLAAGDQVFCNWGDRLRADLPKLLGQFQELFNQEEAEETCTLILNREFLSDNVIRLMRESYRRAVDHQRRQMTPMDVLICLLTASNSIVAECFERIGVTAAKLTELAVMAEQHTSRS